MLGQSPFHLGSETCDKKQINSVPLENAEITTDLNACVTGREDYLIRDKNSLFAKLIIR